MVFKVFYRILFYYSERVNENVIRKVLWDIFIEVLEVSKLIIWKNLDCIDMVWSRNILEILDLVFWFLYVFGEKNVFIIKLNKEGWGKGINYMFKNN